MITKNKEVNEAKSVLISSYIDIIAENFIVDVNMINEQYLKDVCMANIQDEIDFSDVEEQIKTSCENCIKKELEKLINKISL